MPYKYYDLSVLFAGIGMHLDTRYLQYFLAAKRCCLLPMYFHDGEHSWVCSIAAFDVFMDFFRTQQRADYSNDELMLLSQIKTEFDPYCPFDFTELGSLFNLGLLVGTKNKSGPLKRKTQIYVKSYWALKSYQEKTYLNHREEFENIGDAIFH